MNLTIDFETRSRIDLKKRGVYVYAEDPSTDALCLAVKIDEKPAGLYVPPAFRDLAERAGVKPDFDDGGLRALIERATTIEAHNATFERLIWHHVMHKRYGFPDLRLSNLRCSAAKAAALALPRSLGDLCAALGLHVQKDMTGWRVMMKMCKPNRHGQWNEDPMDYAVLCRYCKTDVEAEHAASADMRDLSADEQATWQLDQIINDRGIYVDREAIDNLRYKIAYEERRLLRELDKISHGYLKSTRQRDKTMDWLKLQGVDLDDLTMGTVREAVRNVDDPTVKRMLEIRLSLASSSVKKLDAMINWACADGRIRGTMMYHGASTGRWGGKGIQPQNYPRTKFKDKDIDAILDMGVDELNEKHPGVIRMDGQDPESEIIAKSSGVYSAAKLCLRGMLTAAPGKRFLIADFASVEARVLAWLANERWKIDGFKAYDEGTGPDMYKLAYAVSFGVPLDQVTPELRTIGKVQELALGYSGWVGAFRLMGANYGLRFPEDERDRLTARAREQYEANEITDDILFELWATPIIKAWREANASIVSYWKLVGDAAIGAVKDTSRMFEVGPCKFKVVGKYLHIKLPSGRLISYREPRIVSKQDKFGRTREVIEFMGVDSKTHKWCKQYAYAGTFVNNLVQSTCRDLMVEAMQRCEKKGLPISFHVHDEVIAEVDENDKTTIEEFEKIVAEVPAWAKGCPLGAEAFTSRRYRKG